MQIVEDRECTVRQWIFELDLFLLFTHNKLSASSLDVWENFSHEESKNTDCMYRVNAIKIVQQSKAQILYLDMYVCACQMANGWKITGGTAKEDYKWT